MAFSVIKNTFGKIIYIFFFMQATLYIEYAPIFVFIVFAFALALIIFGLSYALAINAGDPEKLSPYECGFEPFDDARNTFDIRFYLVAILFILFDLEATFLFPWATTLSNLTNLGFWSMFDFIFELVIGFIYAWKIGSLEWE
jgi:NADH-quinone oxidoreductase subunit A